MIRFQCSVRQERSSLTESISLLCTWGSMQSFIRFHSRFGQERSVDLLESISLLCGGLCNQWIDLIPVLDTKDGLLSRSPVYIRALCNQWFDLIRVSHRGGLCALLCRDYPCETWAEYTITDPIFVKPDEVYVLTETILLLCETWGDCEPFRALVFLPQILRISRHAKGS